MALIFPDSSVENPKTLIFAFWQAFSGAYHPNHLPKNTGQETIIKKKQILKVI
jgi:hypothetical protein